MTSRRPELLSASLVALFCLMTVGTPAQAALPADIAPAVMTTTYPDEESGALAALTHGRTIRLPQRLTSAEEILRAVHEQTGLKYAFCAGALVRQRDTTPFAGKVEGLEWVGLLANLAPHVTVANGVILLEGRPDPAEFNKLVAALKSDKADDRRVAAYLLGNTKSTQAIAPLVAALDDKDESVRHHALRSLDRLERDFRPVLANDPPQPFIRPDYRPAGRVSIFAVVAGLPADKLVALMKSAADRTTNQWLWSAGLLSRGRAFPEGLAVELGLGEKDGYATTRTIARWSHDRLATAEGQSAVNPNVSYDPAKRLAALPGEKDPARRAQMLLDLGQLGGPAVWNLLLAEANNTDPLIRRSAIRALRHCPDPRAIPLLVHWLIGDGVAGDDRDMAAMSLGMIGGQPVVDALGKYVDSAKTPISSAAMALGWTGLPTAVPALARCLKTDSVNLHMFAYTALWQIGSADAVKAMLPTYNEYDNTARYMGHAAIRLAAHNQQGLDYLVDWVNKGTSRITVHGLEMCEDPRAVDALLATIPRSKGDRLQYALQALGRIGDPKAVPLLVSLMDSADSAVAYDAMRALRWRWYFNRPDVQAAFAKHPLFKAVVEKQPALADQAPNTWVLRKWQVDFDDYRAVGTTYEAGMAFDESTGLVTKVNAHGQRCDAPQMGETWLYDPAANAWRMTRAGINPFGMCGTWGIDYDRAARRVVFLEAEGGHHGWKWDRGRALRASTNWVYDGQRERWTPMNPLHRLSGPGLRGFQPVVYNDKAGVIFLHGGEWGGNNDKALAGRSWTYDTRTNTWTLLPESRNQLPNGTHDATCYLPNVDKVLVAGRKDRKTWLFDLATNTWTDAAAKGDPPAMRLPMRYDPASGCALAFLAAEHGTAIWQYDPKANAWSRLDAPAGMTPHHDSVDCVYDSAHNVFVMDGGHLGWNTDHIAVREVWTYRRAAGEPTPPPAPPPSALPPLVEGVVVSVMPDATVKVAWEKSADPAVAGYNVYAADVGVGDRMHPRDVYKSVTEFKKLNAEPVKATELADGRKLAAAAGLFNHAIRAYYVKAVTAAGVESGPSATVITLTSSVPNVSAEELPDGSTQISWDAAPEAGVRGYTIYRMDVTRTSSPFRLNPVPADGTQYIDQCDAPRAERRRYYVVAVDALGQEGLPSTGAWAFGRP
ncbi:MAG: hypothetical protein BIFFINMI_01863 [Phycisphaerae bacterium]|nr:hypothetical protein [Phycisphaerae bacterium]